MKILTEAVPSARGFILQQACSQGVGWCTDSARTLDFESNVLTQQMFWVLLGWMSHHDA